ncbi:MAG: methionyl-tRNA formyltransferase [Gammaproteobacteria bacterium]|nr:methionyl-tRNA formyltransferase [Sideroxydans sp.]MBU3904249.1 methionyl-tRNA formyltransferase [Gammaproteobacteria bacterium]MBU4046740.1 methionyl-tRNA formyltransferase [Gammaproteobacteria bacterium]MBU4151019.1 methionyl-tRNA formyltransferase [Gammaproteobacteria bacterium]
MNIIFAGTPHFAASALAALLNSGHKILAVLTQPDRPAGRGMQLTASPVKKLALEHDIPVLQPASLKSEEIQQTLRALKADVMVVAAYGLILPSAVLDIPRLGCLNIHASLLPRWRGAAPIQRAILAGDAETGITIMQMDVGLDTGDMLFKYPCPILATDDAQSLHDKLADIGATGIVDALQQLEKGTVHPEKQDDSQACYAAKLSKQEALVDWSLDSVVLERMIRGYFPFPAAHTEFNGTPIKLLRARPGLQETASPGTVLGVNKSEIVVACGRGTLALEVLQKPGGKPLPAVQFVQGFPLKAGDRFGVDKL